MVWLAQKIRQCMGECLNRRSGCFLHEQITVVAMLKGIENQIHGVSKRHHEACHVRIGNRQRLTGTDLLDKQRNNRATGRHHVAVARPADDGFFLIDVARLGNHHLFHHCLGNTHGIDRVNRFVGAKAHDPADLVLDSSFKNVIGADNVGFDSFHRVKLTGWNLLESGSMINEVNTTRGVKDTLIVSDITNVKLQLRTCITLAHVVLLFLVPAEDTNFADITIEKALENSVPERAGPTGNQKGFIFKHIHPPNSVKISK